MRLHAVLKMGVAQTGQEEVQGPVGQQRASLELLACHWQQRLSPGDLVQQWGQQLERWTEAWAETGGSGEFVAVHGWAQPVPARRVTKAQVSVMPAEVE